MASELRVNTLKDASGNNSIATSFVARGSAKAYYHINVDGDTILDSLNISSHDDDGEGDGGIHLSSNMGSANYSCSLSHDDAGAGSTLLNSDVTRDTQADGTFDYEVVKVNSTTNRTNQDAVRFGAIHGDLL
jgi:hypothetical protein